MADTDQAFFAQFLEDYFAECDEHLIAVRHNLLALERFGQQSRLEPALVEELLRRFHSIKGLSGMVGFGEVEQVAHQIESYLRLLGQANVQLTAGGLDALIDGTQTIEQVIGSRRLQQPTPNVTPIIARLGSLISTHQTVSPAPGVEPSPTPYSETPALSSEAESRLAGLLALGQRAWHISFVPSTTLAKQGVNINYIRARLQEIGELIHVAPRLTTDGAVSFELLVAGQIEETTLAAWQIDGLTWTPYGLPSVGPLPDVTRHPPTGPGTSPIPLTPSNIVRVDLARLDALMQVVGELIISRARLQENLTQLKAMAPEPQWRALQETNVALERQLRDLREGILQVRMVPIGEVFERMRFVIRDLARESQKEIALEVSGQETNIDKFMVERLMDPLLHLVRNAISHGLEPAHDRQVAGKPVSGSIALRAATAGDTVVITVEDDGRGLDAGLVRQRAHAL